jgi:alpha-galactosidase
MVGGDLTAADAWTTSLLTNREVLDPDQYSSGNRVAISSGQITIWVADQRAGSAHYVAVFNRGETTQMVHYPWNDLGLASGKYKLRDLWEQKDLANADSLSVTLPSHAVALYAIDAVRTSAQ